jgi:hypothetical protein
MQHNELILLKEHKPTMEFKTVEQVAKFTKEQLLIYRRTPSKIDYVIEELSNVYTHESQGWELVVNANEFVASFKKVVGKKDRANLKKLLSRIDKKWRTFNYDIEV